MASYRHCFRPDSRPLSTPTRADCPQSNLNTAGANHILYCLNSVSKTFPPTSTGTTSCANATILTHPSALQLTHRCIVPLITAESPTLSLLVSPPSKTSPTSPSRITAQSIVTVLCIGLCAPGLRLTIAAAVPPGGQMAPPGRPAVRMWLYWSMSASELRFVGTELEV